MNREFTNCITLFSLALISTLASSIRVQGPGLSIGEFEEQRYPILKKIPTRLTISKIDPLHNQMVHTGTPHTTPNLSRKLLKFSHAFTTSRHTRKSMKALRKKLQLEGTAHRLLDKLESADGSTIIPPPTKHDAVQNEHMFDMHFGDRGDGDCATPYTTQAQKRAGALTAPRQVYSNVHTEFIHNNDNDNDNDDDDDDDDDDKYAKRGGNSSNPIVHGSNGSEDFSASFHADYHNPRTHPPKNN